MNLYLLTQHSNRGYDTYDSMVVAAESEEDARLMHPETGHFWHFGIEKWCRERTNGWTISPVIEPTNYHGWAWHISDVTIKYLGVADPSIDSGLILASFNAG